MDSLVYLRAFEPDDYITSIKLRNDDQIWALLGGGKFYVSGSYEKKWIEDAIFDSKNIRLAICLSDGDRYIGNVSITNVNQALRSGESNIFIGDHSCWGKGFGANAYKQLLEYAFKERGFHRIEARVLDTNVASMKLHEKCGFKKEGILRETVFKNGCWQNQVVFSILESEFLRE